MPPYVWTAARRRYWAKTLKYHHLTERELNLWRKELLEAQDFKCAICRASLQGKPANLDHCHDTGEVRGMLCGWCNRSISIHSTEKLRLMLDYAENPPARLFPFDSDLGVLG